MPIVVLVNIKAFNFAVFATNTLKAFVSADIVGLSVAPPLLALALLLGVVDSAFFS